MISNARRKPGVGEKMDYEELKDANREKDDFGISINCVHGTISLAGRAQAGISSLDEVKPDPEKGRRVFIKILSAPGEERIYNVSGTWVPPCIGVSVNPGYGFEEWFISDWLIDRHGRIERSSE